MENSTTLVTPVNTGIRYGILFGVIGIILDIILKVTQLSFKYSVSISASISMWVIGVILAHQYFKKHNSGFMTYGQGIIIAIVSGLVSGLFTGIFNYFYVNFVDVNYVTAMRADMEAWLIRLNAPEEQIEKSLADITQEKLGSPLTILKAIFGGAIGGFFISLIVSAITKHNRPEFE